MGVSVTGVGVGVGQISVSGVLQSPNVQHAATPELLVTSMS